LDNILETLWIVETPWCNILG